MQARAAVMPERHGRWTIETLEVAEPGPQEVLVRVVASGICQTDVHARDGFFPIPCPAVYGHEGAGVVEQVGSAVTTLKPGDHVIMANPSCGACPDCLAGFETYCSNAPMLKQSGYRADGTSLSFRRGQEPIYGSFFQQSSFASLTIAMARNTIRVPDDVPLDILAAFPCGVNTGAGAVHERAQAAARRLLRGVRHGDRRLCGAARGQAGGLRPHHRGRRVRRAPGARAQSGGDAHRQCHGPAAGRRGQTTRGRAWGTVLPRSGGHSPRPCAPRSRCSRRAVPPASWAARAPGSRCPWRCGPCNRAACVRGCIQGESDVQTFLPHLIDLYRAGKLPIERLVRHYPHAAINDAVADMLAGKTIKAVLQIGTA